MHFYLFEISGVGASPCVRPLPDCNGFPSLFSIRMSRSKDASTGKPLALSNVMSLDESLDALPGVGRGNGVISCPAIKEAVRRIRVYDDLVFDACFIQIFVESLYVAGRDTRIGTTEETQDRAGDMSGFIKHATCTTRQNSAQTRIEADSSRLSKILGCGKERYATTQAETNAKDRGVIPILAQISNPSSYVAK